MVSSKEQARQQMLAELQGIVQRNRVAFEGTYAEQIRGLLGLSEEDLRTLTPDAPHEAYDQLIEVVKDASRKNLAQAELRSRIEALGEAAISIAKRVSSLGAILA